MAITFRALLSEDAAITTSYGGMTVRREYRVIDDAVKDDSWQLFQNWKAYGKVNPDTGNTEYGEKPGDAYFGNSQTLCKTVKPKREGKDKDGKGGYYWIVTVEYQPNDFQSSSTFTDTTQKITYSSGEDDNTDGRYDLDGKPNVNSVGDFFENKLPLKNIFHVYNYSFTATATQAQLIYSANNTTNSDIWFTRPIGTCLLRNFKADRFLYTQNEFRYNVSFEIAYNLNGWKYYQADCGYYDDNGPLYEEDGAQRSTPELLDGNGEVLPPGDDPFLIDFKIYGSSSFTALTLDDPGLI